MEEEQARRRSARIMNLEQEKSTKETQIVNPTDKREDEEYHFGAPSEWDKQQMVMLNVVYRPYKIGEEFEWDKLFCKSPQMQDWFKKGISD
jgi:hypothetical protein